jgi:hypothetical protein
MVRRASVPSGRRKCAFAPGPGRVTARRSQAGHTRASPWEMTHRWLCQVTPGQAQVISFAARSLCQRSRREPLAPRDSRCSSQAGVSPTPVETPAYQRCTGMRFASRVDRCSDSSTAALPGERSGAGGSAVASRAEMTWSRKRTAPQRRRSAPRPRWPGRASRCRRVHRPAAILSYGTPSDA